jgi:hypothetical protein
MRAAPSIETMKPMPAPNALVATTLKPQPERSSEVEAASTPRPQLATALVATAQAPTGPIEVEVHRSSGGSGREVANVDAEGNSRRSLGGILLRQARNVVRGDRVSLTETGLPETVTVQARLAGRTLTKVIQL